MEIKTTRKIYTNCVHEDSWKKYEGAILCMDWDKRWVAVDEEIVFLQDCLNHVHLSNRALLDMIMERIEELKGGD